MNMTTMAADGKIVIVGGGPVGSLAALYASHYHDNVEVYELRGGMFLQEAPILIHPANKSSSR